MVDLRRYPLCVLIELDNYPVIRVSQQILVTCHAAAKIILPRYACRYSKKTGQ